MFGVGDAIATQNCVSTQCPIDDECTYARVASRCPNISAPFCSTSIARVVSTVIVDVVVVDTTPRAIISLIIQMYSFARLAFACAHPTRAHKSHMGGASVHAHAHIYILYMYLLTDQTRARAQRAHTRDANGFTFCMCVVLVVYVCQSVFTLRGGFDAPYTRDTVCVFVAMPGALRGFAPRICAGWVRVRQRNAFTTYRTSIDARARVHCRQARAEHI